MITVSLIENKKTPSGKKGIEKRKFEKKKPKSLKDFKTSLLSEFNTNNPKFIKIYSVDWEGEATEIKEEDDYKDEDNKAFRVIYDTDIPSDDIDNKSDEFEKENKVKNDESIDSINEKELMSILDEELKDEKEEENIFDSKIFCDNLLKDFISKQNIIVNITKEEINNNIENIMNEKSQIFMDLKNIPQIQDSILKTTSNIIQSSKIEKKNEKNEPRIKINKEIENEQDEKKEEYDLKFLENDLTLNKTVKEAKYIDIDVKIQNIGKKTFSGGDLYFSEEDGSSEEFYFTGVGKDKKQDICLTQDLKPTEITEEKLTIRNEEPIEGQTYFFNVTIKGTEDKNIKMKKPLKIIIKIIEDKNNIKEKEREEEEKKEKEEKERLEREKEREERERRKREEEKKRKENEDDNLIEDKKDIKNINNDNNDNYDDNDNNKDDNNKGDNINDDNNKDNNDNNNNNNNNNDNNDEHDDDNDEDKLVQKIYDDLEERFYISTFKSEEEIKEMIRNLNCDKDRIESWVESIM